MKQTLSCLHCAAHTPHLLRRESTGSVNAYCANCNQCTKTYTPEEITQVVTDSLNKLFGQMGKTTGDSVPPVRVFLECHGDVATEKEADAESILAHMSITGAIPEVGKPMYAKGPSTQGVALPLPYGNVLRVETPTQEKDTD